MNVLQQIENLFEHKGHLNYGVEAVTQLQHALQCGTLAIQEGTENELVIAAFLHDIGHLLGEEDLPNSLKTNLDDKHEELGYQFLKQNFSPEISEPVRLHVAAKRYLCTIEADYADQLSPTSYESYIDQGGPMTQEEQLAFENEAFFKDAVKLRRWDDVGKKGTMETYPIAEFINRIKQLFGNTTIV